MVSIKYSTTSTTLPSLNVWNPIILINISYTPLFQELDWPFELFTARLKQNLFSPKWEVRHGAASALREIMKVHGKTCGYSADVEKTQVSFLTYRMEYLNVYACSPNNTDLLKQMLENHQLWLEDLSLHLLCVLSLDRFGDFISDQVVAPVRETCAQCLGTLYHLTKSQLVQLTSWHQKFIFAFVISTCSEFRFQTSFFYFRYRD